MLEDSQYEAIMNAWTELVVKYVWIEAFAYRFHSQIFESGGDQIDKIKEIQYVLFREFSPDENDSSEISKTSDSRSDCDENRVNSINESNNKLKEDFMTQKSNERVSLIHQMYSSRTSKMSHFWRKSQIAKTELLKN